MGERADEIEAQITRSRSDLSNNLNQLEEKVKGMFDWKMQVRERPIAMLALAFGGGLVASALLPSRPPRYDRIVKDRSPRVSDSNRTTAPEALRRALMTVAASTIGGVLGDIIRAYRAEVHKSA